MLQQITAIVVVMQGNLDAICFKTNPVTWKVIFKLKVMVLDLTAWQCDEVHQGLKKK